MFHRNSTNNQDPNANNNGGRRGFFSHFGHRGQQRPTSQSAMAVDQGYYGNGPYGNNSYGGGNGPYGGYYRDPYYEGSTRSDWDHYAVRHEEALIGDPLPIVNNGLNLAAQRYDPSAPGPYGTGPLGNGPINHGYDDAHFNNRRRGVPNNFDRNGNPLIGPVTANGPLAGNYSSGTVVERNLVQGPGRRTRTGWVDEDMNGRQWGSTAWGSDPLYGSGPGMQQGGWGSQPLYGYRDSRTMATPLLPDNPWTHNELGRDYMDAYSRGTLAYSSVNNAFTAPPITEAFTTYGPNGELIEGTRTRVIREEIVPPRGGQQALGSATTQQTTTIVKDEIIPITGVQTNENIPIVSQQKSVVLEKTSTTIQPQSTVNNVNPQAIPL